MDIELRWLRRAETTTEPDRLQFRIRTRMTIHEWQNVPVVIAPILPTSTATGAQPPKDQHELQ